MTNHRYRVAVLDGTTMREYGTSDRATANRFADNAISEGKPVLVDTRVRRGLPEVPRTVRP